MGGFFSGSHPRSERGTTDEFLSLDIRALPRYGVLDIARAQADGRAEVEVLAISPALYECRLWIGTETKSGFGGPPDEVPRCEWMSQASMFLPLTTTRPNFGGSRIWFRCPRSNCRRRSRILYRAPDTNARAFACRLCCGLDYPTQRMSRAARLSWRADKKAQLLVQVSRSEFTKPLRMRNVTFRRIVAEVEALDRAADALYVPRLQKTWEAIRLRVASAADADPYRLPCSD